MQNSYKDTYCGGGSSAPKQNGTLYDQPAVRHHTSAGP